MKLMDYFLVLHETIAPITDNVNMDYVEELPTLFVLQEVSKDTIKLLLLVSLNGSIISNLSTIISMNVYISDLLRGLFGRRGGNCSANQCAQCTRDRHCSFSERCSSYNCISRCTSSYNSNSNQWSAWC